MQKLLREYLDELNRKQKRRRKTVIAVVLAAIMLVSGVIWNLTQYGIAMTDEPKCGMEEHTHSDSCYTNVLVCGREESEGHTHTDACYQTVSELICGQEESEEHTHSEACYQTVSELICGQEESAGHTHTEACYEKQLVCGKEEHTHSEACYIDTTADVEDASIWNAQYADIEWKDAWGEDLVIAAKKQIGYKESTDNYTVATDGSHKGYTRYGQFAGDVYADWDAVFVNFCMHYAGLEKTGLFPKETETAKWHEKFAKGNAGQNAAYLTDAKDYEPQIGDILFFQKEKEETDDQMGIISSYDKEKNEIKVIEGNSDNAVKENKYAADDTHITAYLKITELEEAYKNEDAEQPEEKTIFEQEEEETEQFTQTAETENYVVIVQYGSDAALPENAQLKVEEFGKESEEFVQKTEELGYEPEWLLDIGFYDGESEVEPEGNVTVKIKSKAVKGIADYDIVHFGNEGTEKLDGIGQEAEEGNLIVEFTTDSFSIFAGVPAQAAIAPQAAETEGDLGKDLAKTALNEWQIVDQGFTGSTSEHKKTSADDMVRVQKNVVPTDVENEFLVYLSMDMNSWWQNFFERATYKATTSNNYHSSEVGTIVNKMTGNQNVTVSTQSGSWGNIFTIKDDKGNVLAEMPLYFSQANKITVYLELGGGKYLLLGVEVDTQSGAGSQVILSKETMDEINKLTKQYSVDLMSVTDTMGDYIEFQGVVNNTAGTKVDVAADKRSFTWDVSSVKYPEDGEGWATNVAELVYKVKLNVKQDGFKSCADNMNSKVDDPESYEVNKGATLAYQYITTQNGQETGRDDKTIEFQKPYVRGLLYNYSFIKKGQNGDTGAEWVLPGAEFKLEKVNTADNTVDKDFTAQTATSDKDGKVSFEDLEWGTYRLTETKAPGEEYKIPEIKDITLCYTTDRDGVTQDTTNLPNMKNVERDDNNPVDMVVYNKVPLMNVVVQKHWEDNNSPNRPSEITVKLKGTIQPKDSDPRELTDDEYAALKMNDESLTKVLVKGNGWSDVWKGLPQKDANGNSITWSVEETNVPEGYIVSYPEQYPPTTEDIKTDESKSTLLNIEETENTEDTSESESEEKTKTQTCHIVNKFVQQEWQIVKKSSSEGGALLEGAEFELRESNNSVLEVKPIYYGKSEEDGIVNWYKTKDSDGTLSNPIETTAIPNGTYTLVETKSPVGYSVGEPWIIEISSQDPLIKVTDNSGREISHVGEDVLTYTFENEALYSLPEAGGPGIYWYIFSGILLMAGAMLIIYKNKCKEVLKS